MWRWTRRFLAGIVGLIVIAGSAGALYQAWVTSRTLRAHPPPGRLVDIGGHRLHIWCAGSGLPTVLLDSGLGGIALDWSHVQPAGGGIHARLLVRPRGYGLQRSRTTPKDEPADSSRTRSAPRPKWRAWPRDIGWGVHWRVERAPVCEHTCGTHRRAWCWWTRGMRIRASSWPPPEPLSILHRSHTSPRWSHIRASRAFSALLPDYLPIRLPPRLDSTHRRRDFAPVPWRQPPANC